MTSGWPQNSQDARWPHSDPDDARSASRAGGRVATESDRGDRSSAYFGNEHPSAPLPVTRDSDDRSAATLWTDHPSGPLPVTREPQRRGRLGRGKSRDTGAPGSDAPGDADYDWIRYIGEAGPAQEQSKRPAADRQPSGRPAGGAPAGAKPAGGAPASDEGRAGRGGRNQSRRHAAPARPTADMQGGPVSADALAAEAPVGRRERRSAERARAGYPDPQSRAPQSAAPQSAAPRERRSRHAYPAAEASAAAPPASPVRTQPGRTQPGRTQPGRTQAGDSLTRADDYQTQTYDYRTRADEYRAQPADHRGGPGYSTATPEQGPAWAASGPRAAGRAATQSPASSAPWPVAQPPAEARLAPPEQAQRSAGRRGRGPDPVAEPRTSAFDRPDATATTATTAAVAAPPTRPVPANPGPAKPKRGKAAPAKQRSRDDRQAAARKPARRKRRHPVLLGLVGGGVVGAVAAGGILATGALHGSGSGPEHRIVTPDKLLSYTQNPSLAKGMGAQALRNEILSKGGGEASHVVDAVYEDSASAGSKSGPGILLFVGGNLSGSAQGFISSFTGQLPSSFVINAGSLGGQAACVPGTGGHPAECVWADGDTFGLVASPALNASTLAGELRSIRPLVEVSDK